MDIYKNRNLTNIQNQLAGSNKFNLQALQKYETCKIT